MAEVAVTQPTRGVRRELILLVLALGALSVTSGIFETTFNNFLNDTYHIGADARGGLEFPRELPGFLVAMLGGALFFLSVVRLGVFSTSCVALGLFGLALLGRSGFGTMVVFMFIWSMGSHLMMPVSTSLQLSLAPKGKRASRLGQIGAVTTGATILGSGLVWVWFRFLGGTSPAVLAMKYHTVFIIAGSFALLAAVFVSRLHPPRAMQRPKLVLKRRYSLYYLLCVFSGARKQIFITFGPWVLVKIFHQPAYIFAQLWIIASVVGIVFMPQLGKLIDRLGERKILMFDAVVVFAICLGYGFAQHLPLGRPVFLIYVCYVLDSVIFACSMARATYMDKIAEQESDVHASLSVGVSIDHAVSMTLPFFGGLLWMSAGYPYVFVAAACVAVGNFVVASRVRVPKRHVEEPEPSGQVIPD